MPNQAATKKGVAARPKGENGESQNQEIVAEVLFFREYWHSAIDTAKKWCYNSGVLRRMGKRRAQGSPESLSEWTLQIFCPDLNAGIGGMIYAYADCFP